MFRVPRFRVLKGNSAHLLFIAKKDLYMSEKHREYTKEICRLQLVIFYFF